MMNSSRSPAADGADAKKRVDSRVGHAQVEAEARHRLEAEVERLQDPSASRLLPSPPPATGGTDTTVERGMGETPPTRLKASSFSRAASVAASSRAPSNTRSVTVPGMAAVEEAAAAAVVPEARVMPDLGEDPLTLLLESFEKRTPSGLLAAGILLGHLFGYLHWSLMYSVLLLMLLSNMYLSAQARLESRLRARLQRELMKERVCPSSISR